jgi:hypothetical protein
LPPASATLVVLSAIALVLSQLAAKRDGRRQAVQLAAQHQ